MLKRDKLIIYFLGPSKSGKTTSLERIIDALSQEGIKCGTIKFIHHPNLTIDASGKDSSQHRKAGALFTISFAPKETAIIISKSQRETIFDAKEMLSKNDGIIPDCDIVFCESLNTPPANSLIFLSVNKIDEIEKYSANLHNCNVLGVIGAISNSNADFHHYNGIPVYSALIKKDLDQILSLIKESMN